jgi:hypothetical protein
MSRRFIVLKEHPPCSKREIVPNSDYVQKANSLEARPFPLNIDKDGFIEPSAIHEIPNYKIAFIGDSFVESTFCDELHRFPYLAGRNIESKTGFRVNSYNAGVSGAHTMHGVNILTNKLAPIKPNMIVSMYGLIDLGAFLLHGAYWENRSYPYGSMAYFDKKITEKVLCDFELFIEKFIANTRLMASICGHMKIDLVFATSANLYSNTSDDKYINMLRDSFKTDMDIELHEYIKLLERVNSSILGVAEEFDCGFVDLNMLMPKESIYFYDDMHLNEKGSEVVASILADYITIKVQTDQWR